MVLKSPFRRSACFLSPLFLQALSLSPRAPRLVGENSIDRGVDQTVFFAPGNNYCADFKPQSHLLLTIYVYPVPFKLLKLNLTARTGRAVACKCDVDISIMQVTQIISSEIS